MAIAGVATAQQPNIYYVYDDLSRLVAVVDAQGNAATYTYDAVGNILRIDRFDIANAPGTGPVRITLISPDRGKVGTPVQIFGTGFGATPAQNTLAFTGSGASATEAGFTRLLTTVPTGATTGTISVTSPLGSATSAAVFRVLGTLAVTPVTGTVSVTRTLQFQAEESGTPTTNVRWAVNALPGGDTAMGTITTDGLYTAPATVPTPAIVTVTAIHKDDATITAAATVTILPPQPVFLAARAVSIRVIEPATVSQNVATTVSVVVAETVTPLVVASIASVRVAESQAALAVTAPTAIAIAPVITGVTPTSGAPGTTLTLTLDGSGFGGATAVTLLRNNAADPTIGVANLTVAPDGTQATVDITIDSAAPLGARVVRITTPAGSSTVAGTETNLFTVQ